MISSLVFLISVSLAITTNAKWIDFYQEFPDRHVQRNPILSSKMLSLLPEFKAEFNKFKRQYNKVYESQEEENSRFTNFISSLIEINNHNELYKKGEKQFEMDINHLSDWSAEEFSKLNGLVISNATGSLYMSPNVKLDLPDSIDWRELGAVTEVKDQMFCGSCYAFSTTGSLEGQIWRKTGNLISLSEQQIVDCDNVDHACKGGLVPNTLNYIKYAGGIESEKDYPYVSGKTNKANPLCRFNKNSVVATDTGFVQLPEGDEDKLKEALATVGPISMAFSATHALKYYKKGIFHDPICNIVNINHAVLLVGYGSDEETGKPYWLIKNSWGKNWGDNGYFRLERNVNACNMAMNSFYPLV